MALPAKKEAVKPEGKKFQAYFSLEKFPTDYTKFIGELNEAVNYFETNKNAARTLTEKEWANFSETAQKKFTLLEARIQTIQEQAKNCASELTRIVEGLTAKAATISVRGMLTRMLSKQTEEEQKYAKLIRTASKIQKINSNLETVSVILGKAFQGKLLKPIGYKTADLEGGETTDLTLRQIAEELARLQRLVNSYANIGTEINQLLDEIKTLSD